MISKPAYFFFFSFSPLHLAESNVGLTDHCQLLWEEWMTSRNFGTLTNGPWLLQCREGSIWLTSLTRIPDWGGCGYRGGSVAGQPALILHTPQKHLFKIHQVLDRNTKNLQNTLAWYVSGITIQKCKHFLNHLYEHFHMLGREGRAESICKYNIQVNY